MTKKRNSENHSYWNSFLLKMNRINQFFTLIFPPVNCKVLFKISRKIKLTSFCGMMIVKILKKKENSALARWTKMFQITKACKQKRARTQRKLRQLLFRAMRQNKRLNGHSLNPGMEWITSIWAMDERKIEFGSRISKQK